jgi:hypothetical protein
MKINDANYSEIKTIEEKEPLLKRTYHNLQKYFSSKTVLVQTAGGVGAFAGRSLAAYLSIDLPPWENVLISSFGSFVGYVGIYAISYWYTFRNAPIYKSSKRDMKTTILELQVVEQTPNIFNFLVSASGQFGLMSAGVNPIISANLASWFGPQKIINMLAMLSANSLNKAWVYETWKPKQLFYEYPKKAAHKLKEMVSQLYR